jgi:hypothetical protein
MSTPTDLIMIWPENKIFDTLNDLTGHNSSGLAKSSLRPNQESLIETVLSPIKMRVVENIMKYFWEVYHKRGRDVV